MIFLRVVPVAEDGTQIPIREGMWCVLYVKKNLRNEMRVLFPDYEENVFEDVFPGAARKWYWGNDDRSFEEVAKPIYEKYGMKFHDERGEYKDVTIHDWHPYISEKWERPDGIELPAVLLTLIKDDSL
ncbi:hypothetical protein [Parasphaerochaeta coccoides]|uniref:Uncharacterized protein n=1 Tax=Parasphaerochaeta coccoides (strain ATCC BAA-1237 / DSM 17374 / SPN1) TaxID=760011 RepID=F4GM00_PARC1|nr:hypothetical protein [Parasphaerochaeta coccoides]AEC03041.1 hypothetical protein Spico_1843 [Parasphaerochaeta coccoides DSM 17374]